MLASRWWRSHRLDHRMRPIMRGITIHTRTQFLISRNFLTYSPELNEMNLGMWNGFGMWCKGGGMSCQALRGPSSTVRRAPRWGPLWGALGGTPKIPQGPPWWAVDRAALSQLTTSKLLLPAVPCPLEWTRTWKARHFQGQPLTGGIFIALPCSPFGMRARGCLMPNTTQRGPGCRRGPDRKLGAARHGLARGIADDKWAHTRLHERDGLEILGSSTGCAGANCLGRGATHGMQNITMPGTLRDRLTFLRHTHASASRGNSGG